MQITGKKEVAWKARAKNETHYCRAHDSDADESLDGLELLKAVLHAHHEVHEHEGAKAGYADEQRGGDTDTAAVVSEETFAEVEGGGHHR